MQNIRSMRGVRKEINYSAQMPQIKHSWVWVVFESEVWNISQFCRILPKIENVHSENADQPHLALPKHAYSNY